MFVKAVLSGIEGGIPQGYAPSTAVKFRIGLRSKKDKGGNIKLSVVGIGANRSNEEVIQIEFEVDDVITVMKAKFENWVSTPVGKEILRAYLKQQGIEIPE